MKIRISGQQRIAKTLKQKGKFALAIAMGGFAIFAFIVFFSYSNVGITAQSTAGPQRDGAKTISDSNVILNEYTSLTMDAAAGSNSISVGNACLNSNGRFNSNLTSGDLVMIIQMRTAGIIPSIHSPAIPGSNDNAGNFEFAEVLNVPLATKIILKSGISKNYTCAGKVQIIRVPRFSSLKINSPGSVTVPGWDGTTGGVLAIEVKGETVIDGTIDVTGRGFRAQSFQNDEACLETDPKRIDLCTFENSGQFTSGTQSLDLYTKIFMGNGGDAGCRNDSMSRRSGNGGGVVYLISYGKVSGNGIISADGENSEDFKKDISYHDGVKSAGGSGGSVIVYSRGAAISNVSIHAGGGNRGHGNMKGTCETGYIGGSGGTICITNNNNLKLDVTSGNCSVSNLAPYESFREAGQYTTAPGKIIFSPLNPYSSGGALSVELLDFDGEIKDGAVHLFWSTAAEIDNDYFTIEKSTDGLHYINYGKIEGAGNTTVVQNYASYDLKPSKGNNYYRLKQTDFNKRTEYHKIIIIDFQLPS